MCTFRMRDVHQQPRKDSKTALPWSFHFEKQPEICWKTAAIFGTSDHMQKRKQHPTCIFPISEPPVKRQHFPSHTVPLLLFQKKKKNNKKLSFLQWAVNTTSDKTPFGSNPSGHLSFRSEHHIIEDWLNLGLFKMVNLARINLKHFLSIFKVFFSIFNTRLNVDLCGSYRLAISSPIHISHTHTHTHTHMHFNSTTMITHWIHLHFVKTHTQSLIAPTAEKFNSALRLLQ